MMKLRHTVLAGCLGLGLACGANGSTKKETPATPPSTAAPTQAQLPPNYNPSQSLAPLVKTLAPAVVNLEVSKDSDIPEDHPFRFWFGDPGPQRGAGSGFIISNDGYVLTNNHVVDDADEVIVHFADETTATAKVVGTDPRTDVALVKIQEKGEYPFVRLGDSTGLEVGDWVVAIGNPFGLSHTVTAGIVSAKGRQIGAGIYDDFIQTDASINPGNSGGPLFNLNGEVVGINTAVNAAGQGIAYAVPISMVESRLEELKTDGTIQRGWMGVSLQGHDDALLQSLGVPGGTPGALLSKVYEEMPAAEAGLQNGDFVVSIDGRPVEDSDGLVRQIGQFRPGDKVAIEVYRKGKKKSIKVALGARPDEGTLRGIGQAPQDAPPEKEEERFTGLGFDVAPAAELRRRYRGMIPDGLQGLVVTRVDDDGPAAGRLQPRDIIIDVNGSKVSSKADLERIAGNADGSLLMVVQRGGSQNFVAIPLNE